MKYFWTYGLPVYANILKDKIWFNGSYTAVKIFDGCVPPQFTDEPLYVILGERVSNQTANKCIGQFDASILVQVVSKSSDFNYATTEDVANQILGLINTFANPDCRPDFQVVTTVVSTFNTSGLNPTDNVFRTMLRFEHKVLQL